MADGRHCPVCGAEVGYWAVALSAMPWVRCRRCRTRLTYPRTRQTVLVYVFCAVCLVVMCGVPAVLVGLEVSGRGASELGALAAGLGTLIVLSLGFGFAVQMALTPVLRRRRPLQVWGRRDEPSEESW